MSKSRPKILIVEDQEDMREVLRMVIERAGMQTLEAEDGRIALESIRCEAPDMVLLDIRMPGMDGREVLRRLKEWDRRVPVIMMTAFGCIQDAVGMVKAGAFDYLAKPFDHKDLLQIIRRGLKERPLAWISEVSGHRPEGRRPLPERMGHSSRIQALCDEVANVAPTDFSILITGETGAGKEAVAQAVHAQSSRSLSPFVAVDCGAIPDTLIESALFGYEKGAFTGAERAKEGLFQEASGGTLFLDEVSNLPLPMQTKLLRVLQERCFYRVGGNRAIKADARIVAAANLDLVSEAGRAVFRTDLYYRLSEYVLHVPPLRERKEDIPFLVNRFLDATNRLLEKQVKGFSDSALDLLMAYDWPGNVRELHNVVRKAVLSATEIVEPIHLRSLRPSKTAVPAPSVDGSGIRGEPLGPGRYSLKEIVHRNTMTLERTLLCEVLNYTGGNKAETARILQVDYKTIHTKIKQYGIAIPGGDHDKKES
ncbi:MAG: sigma-54-dependent Fis family transcriptional regulator [Nitrospirae bacterium]|nr:sigma-54-dependent Fis family transcriptional regulator [Nitrospirota bacterium]